MRDDIEVRPFASEGDYERMIDYFLEGGEAFLRGMGIDPGKVPERADWLARVTAEHPRPDDRKERFYVAWYLKGEPVGHSSISHIQHGASAHVHLHLWRPELRRSGLGTELVARSIDLYFERFRLERILCEPFAENPAPNRVMAGLGFRLLERRRMAPNPITFVQDVNRWEMTREEWAQGRAERGPGGSS
jgi:RimJ/RimL family protein N-acetyltransferase